LECVQALIDGDGVPASYVDDVPFAIEIHRSEASSYNIADIGMIANLFSSSKHSQGFVRGRRPHKFVQSHVRPLAGSIDGKESQYAYRD
jgi:hypothetical protein